MLTHIMFISRLTCIPTGFVPAFTCGFTIANAHANGTCRVSVPPMSIASVGSGKFEKLRMNDNEFNIPDFSGK